MCIVECIGGLEPAHTYCIQALQAHKHVVTSNKAMMARFYDELLETAVKHNVTIRFSACVGGGIPWLDQLASVKKTDTIESFYGIMNGTSNYILHQIFMNHLDFDTALRQAKQLGYAEADPTADIEGFDVANKVALSANVAWNTMIDINDIPMCGISTISKDDIDYANNNNYRIRLLGHGIRQGNAVCAYVCPEFIPMDHPIAHVPLNYNRFECNSAYLGAIRLMGQGAGRYPTAHNVVKDIRLVKSHSTPFTSIVSRMAVTSANRRFYIRANDLSGFEPYIETRINDTTILTKEMDTTTAFTLYKGIQNKNSCMIGVSLW